MPGRILIADDVATNRIVLKSKLSASHYDVVLAGTRADVASLATTAQPDVILIDLGHPAADALALMQSIRTNPVTREIGLIALGAGRDPVARRAALAAGADDVMTRPLDDDALLARIRAIIRARNQVSDLGVRDETRAVLGLAEPPAAFEMPGSIALVASRAETAIAWKTALSPHLRDRLEVVRPDRMFGPDTIAGRPDVFVIATDLTQRRDGLMLISELRSRSNDRHAGIVAVVPEGDTEAAVAALDLGANDIVEEPLDPLELVLRLRRELGRKGQADRLRRQVRDGLRLAATDPLTGLYNRRYALSQLARIAERSDTTGRSYAVMLLDLDRFKRINDTFGHAAGDAVLIEVGRRLSGNMRSVDTLARIGGEEFLVLMPDTTAEAAMTAGERFRRVVQDEPISLPDGSDRVSMTISIGVAIGPRPQHDPAGLLAEADRALYAAKADGRNQVTFSRSAA